MKQEQEKSKILFFNDSTFTVAKLLFTYPNKVFHIRLLEKETGLSTTTITRTLDTLIKCGIAKTEETSLTKNVRANIEDAAYTRYKRIFNLYRLERYAVSQKLVDILRPSALVVFGSFAKGEDIEESDIDILAITTHQLSERQQEEIQSYLLVIEKEFKRKVDLHILPTLAKSSKEFKNAVANGIVLEGYLKVI